ncbi:MULTISPECIES: ABC transporter substrate-binding protein [unclassified Nocardiopsis]|uniref:ABC transporter substrate-binding protein n=1 Tax=Nocardiopsis TaxID=2013 RepID=UPI00387B39AC
MTSPSLPETPAPQAPRAPDRRPLIIGAVALAVVLMGTAAGAAYWLRTPSVGDPLAVSPEPLALGLFSAEGSTGPKQEAIALALEEVNAVGGVLGHEVAVPVAAEETDPLAAAGVHAVLGSHALGSADLIPEITGAGILYCGNAEIRTLAPLFGDGLYFSVLPGQDLLARALLQVAAEDGRERIAVGSAPGEEAVLDALLAEGGRLGVEIVEVDTLEPVFASLGSPDAFEDTAADLIARDVDAFIGVDPGGSSLLGDALVGQGFPAEGIYLPERTLDDPSAALEDRGPAGATLVRHHRPDGGFPEINPDTADHDLSHSPQLGGVTAALYDCVNLIALAAESAGSVEPAEIAAHLPAVSADGRECTGYADCLARVRDGQDIAYVGPRGPLTWDDTNRLVDVPFEVVRLHGEGGPVDTEVRTFSLGS